MTFIARHEDMRRNNRRLVLSALRRTGILSRTDICQATGLSPASVSAFAAALIAEGVLVADEPASAVPAKRGRPQTALALNPRAASVLAVMMTVNEVRAAVFDYAGTERGAAGLSYNSLGGKENEIVEAVTTAGRAALGAAGDAIGPLLSVRIGVQGTVDDAGRTLLWSPFTRFRDMALADRLEVAFAAPVTLAHDCAMIVESLRWRDPGSHGSDFLAILQAEGIGMGLYLKGALFAGARSSAGEFGHMLIRPGGSRCRCGRKGCVEAYASSYAVWRRAGNHDPDQVPDRNFSAADMQVLADRARNGDIDARAAFEEAGAALGYAVGNLFALTDPVPVSIVGLGAAAFDLTERSMRVALAETFTGSAAASVPIEGYVDDMRLTADGCRMTALVDLDRSVFALGDVLESAAE